VASATQYNIDFVIPQSSTISIDKSDTYVDRVTISQMMPNNHTPVHADTLLYPHIRLTKLVGNAANNITVYKSFLVNAGGLNNGVIGFAKGMVPDSSSVKNYSVKGDVMPTVSNYIPAL